MLLPVFLIVAGFALVVSACGGDDGAGSSQLYRGSAFDVSPTTAEATYEDQLGFGNPAEVTDSAPAGPSAGGTRGFSSGWESGYSKYYADARLIVRVYETKEDARAAFEASCGACSVGSKTRDGVVMTKYESALEAGFHRYRHFAICRNIYVDIVTTATLDEKTDEGRAARDELGPDAGSLAHAVFTKAFADEGSSPDCLP